MNICPSVFWTQQYMDITTQILFILYRFWHIFTLEFTIIVRHE
ncbi:hypothetical protein M6B38_116730 [Iris pallida]|uniref:Uncharacterized protein n=1 Tax=Iris pallida TaxID=29817 RepID=A0AAX6DPY9_IRIPA|nr:hypothetical protein M6B38_234730 [Iris pallida]KAJ6847934.1 hypothetical protein M6B38_116730 [Iris pallida]